MKAKIFLAVLGFLGLSAKADEFSSWEWLVPKPAGIFLSKVVFDGTRFVGVGDMGIILSSTNGTNWHLGFTETTNRMFGIMAGGGRLVASGAFGTLLVSTNADYWVQPPTSFEGPINAVAYGLERYVLINGQHPFLSFDALNWEQQEQQEHVFEGGADDMAFGNDLFVAVGWRGLIATSTNGINWVKRESGTTGPIKGVAYGEGRWVAVGGEGNSGIILTSEDAVTWFLQTTDKPLVDVAYGPFGFIATGGGFMEGGVSLNSSDGVYFSGGEPGAGGLDTPPRGVACGNGVCVAVGGNGRIWVTDDGINWVPQTTGHEHHIRSLATDGTTLVAVGFRGTILSSTNGLDFTSHSVSPNESFIRVAHTGGEFVAIGAQDGVVRTSPNGTDWTREGTGSTAALKAVAHGNDTTVIIGWDASSPPYGQFLVRVGDGPWQTVRPAENEYIYTQIAFGNGRFVAAGYDGHTWVSNDGLQWEKRPTGVAQTLVPLQFINGRFIACTRNEVGFSDDGLNWTFTPGNPPPSQQIAHGNGVYVAAGSTWGGIQVSPDAINWTKRPMKTLSLGSVAYFQDSFYVSGFILKSASSLVPEITQFGRSGGELNFHLFGRIGREYELQSSTNLIEWAHAQDYTQSARHHPLTLPTGPDQRFYRVKLKEP
jgi:hypothetical protein